MKFGNYKLTSVAADPCDKKRRNLSLFRPGTVKSTANYIVGKVHRRIGSVVSTRMSSAPTPAPRGAGGTEATREKLTRSASSPSNVSESSSTLSYRASLFGDRPDDPGTPRPMATMTLPRFSPRDFPTSWIQMQLPGLDSTPFGPFDGGRQQEEAAFQAFGSRAHLFHKNKSISGKCGVLPFTHVEGAQLAPYACHSLKSGSTLRRSAQTFGGSCPEIHAPSDTMQSRRSYKSQRSSNGGGGRFRKSRIVQLLERNEHEENDEKTEMAILQEYFDTMSYTEIVKDRDFRHYLMKKRYLDIMEYIYCSSGGASECGQFSRAPSTAAPPSLPVSNNDCDSGYKDEMLSEEMSSLVPPGLQGKSDVLFGNLHELYTFHNDIFLKDLENCISTTELVALCFVQRRDTFFRLYSYYCQNIPRSERLRETLVDTHLFLQECQKKLGHKLPLAAYLLKPKALDCMLVVLKCVNDSMHQIAITGFPADLSQQGELLMQDSFQVWTESKKDLRLRLKTQNRHIFLYQKAMLFCKQGSKTGHNKSTYQFKHWLQMSQIGLTESVRGDSRRFEVWLQGRQEVHTIQAGTIEIKHKWVAEIKRVLLNQLEELKGEKIKQYGLNHKSLRHTASWDVPQAVHGTPNRTASGEQQSHAQANGLGVGGMVGLAQDVVARIAHLNDDSLLNATGISSSSSEHDNQETNAWSSDYSNSEDEFTTVEDSVVPGHKFVSLADYCAMGNSEVSMKEAEVVELLKVGCAGWWFVKVIATGLEGWAPAAYLEPVIRKNSRLRSARSQDKLNDH
uniref:SH3 domain-containing protein n=1 Tax=Anopheles dirus TaxID=7168 RepID=A0A182NHA7_9DIPT